MLVICPIAAVGTQLQSFIISKPKQLIKIAGHPIIDHFLEKMKCSFPQGTRICFIVGYKKELITSYLQAHYGQEFNLIFKEQTPIEYVNDIPLFSGIGDAITLAESEGKDEDVFIAFADRLPVENFAKLLQKLEEAKLDGVLNVQQVPDPEHYGVCVVNNQNIVQKIVEKPSEFMSNLAVQGALLFSARISGKLFHLLKNQSKRPLPMNEQHSLTPIIQQIIHEGARIGIYEMKSPILDFGQIDKFLTGQQYLLQQHPPLNAHYHNLVSLGKIDQSLLLPPVYLGQNVEIKQSVIGPNVSVGDNSVIIRSIISNAVVGDYDSLSNVNTDSSLLGDYVSMENIVKNRISVGDSSTLAVGEK